MGTNVKYSQFTTILRHCRLAPADRLMKECSVTNELMIARTEEKKTTNFYSQAGTQNIRMILLWGNKNVSREQEK